MKAWGDKGNSKGLPSNWDPKIIMAVMTRRNVGVAGPLSSHAITRLLKKILKALAKLEFDDDGKVIGKMPYIPPPSVWAAIAILEEASTKSLSTRVPKQGSKAGYPASLQTAEFVNFDLERYIMGQRPRLGSIREKNDFGDEEWRAVNMCEPVNLITQIPIPQLDENFDYSVTTKSVPNPSKLDAGHKWWYTLGDGFEWSWELSEKR